MGRRWWGAAIVAAVLFTALVAPGIAGTRTGGSALRAPAPDPPSVGDCLQSKLVGQRAVFDRPSMRVFSGSTGACDDTNFGEVVSVQDVDSFGGSSTDRMAVLDPATCLQPTTEYLGWSAPDAVSQAGAVSWRPVVVQHIALLGPGSAQYAAGQRWISCVLIPGAAPYRGSVRGGRPGPAVDAYGACRPTANGADGSYIACGEPHISEVFGVGTVGPDQVPELLQACREIISTETGLTDPTAAGALSIWVESAGLFGSSPQSSGNSGSLDGRCTVSATGGRKLDGSLFGVDNGPLPLVS